MRIGQHRAHGCPISEWLEVTRFRKGSPRSNDAGKRVERKIEAIRACLVGKLVNALVTDKFTAEALL